LIHRNNIHVHESDRLRGLCIAPGLRAKASEAKYAC
jgi:hypothetical protein